MSKVAVITMGVKLDGEKGYTRFRYLCEFLVKKGYEVDLITTTFQHWEKKQRDLESVDQKSYPFGIKFIYEPGYRKNIDLRRVRSHKIAAENLRKLLEKEGDYDLIYAEIPPNDVALAAAEYAHRNKIPFVADVNDLWPEAMRMVFDIPIVSDLLFYPRTRHAEPGYSQTSGAIGPSDEYRDRPFLNQKRDVLKETVYVGNEISVFDREAEQHADEVQKEEGTFWVTYAGTIGTSYDIRTMVLAAEELMKQGKTKIRFQILGDGPTREMLENLAKERKIQNVKFTGYVPYEQMAAYLVKSDVLINSFVRKAPQSIVTKIGDYLAAGKPMINTCMSPEFRKKVEQDGFGINIEPEDVRELVNAVEWMYENEAERNDMGNRARKIAEEQFDRPVSYGKIEAMISSLITKRK